MGRWMAGWVERGRKAGLFLLLVALCAGLGLLIALPLWLFATRQPRLYTVAVLALIAGGVAFLVVRSALRRRRRPLDPARPRRSFLSGLLTALITVITLAGLYLGAVFFYRGLWVIGVVTAVVTALLLWLLGAARAAARKVRKARSIPAETIGR